MTIKKKRKPITFIAVLQFIGWLAAIVLILFAIIYKVSHFIHHHTK